MKLIFFVLFNMAATALFAQFSTDDTLRGSITKERLWWNVLHYQLHLKEINAIQKTIAGEVTIQYVVLSNESTTLQIDLQEPLTITAVNYHPKHQDKSETATFSKIAKNVYYIDVPQQFKGDTNSIIISYSGQPIEAKKAPWDGGIVWSKDTKGNDFIASACQGIGASSWWPCKDHQYDEPENGALITIDVPKHLTGVSNGLLVEDVFVNNIHRTSWKVVNPINNYGINFNIANYTSWQDTYKGLKGDLPLSFYVLPEDLEKAEAQFLEVYRMLEAFEHWFGPYPFYEDGYKLIQVPYLGMEHQSAVSYGNNFQNGYLGRDLSATSWGLNWDFIIIHESGHEWFGNSITSKDIADMWIHEAFTTYSEVLFTEYYFGKNAGDEYAQGIRQNIVNDRAIIGHYNVHKEGSTDMYYKGANMLHTIRHIVNNEPLWLKFFRDMNKKFYHSIVTTEEIEAYMSNYFSIDLSPIFNQYLRTNQIPSLTLVKSGSKWKYQWNDCINGFNMPLDIAVNGKPLRIYPTAKFQKLKARNIAIDSNFYIRINGTFF
ncbi:MAG: M1 family metallopeptidase [Crocinitomicaceae bacterium]|nr:M1 family metallopeptidase [Crocinitomicaceae bacterium]